VLELLDEGLEEDYELLEEAADEKPEVVDLLLAEEMAEEVADVLDVEDTALELERVLEEPTNLERLRQSSKRHWTVW
jgi:hypothetical protein